MTHFAGQSAGPPGFGGEPGLIHEPGGDVLRRLVHPDAFTTFEQLYRALPEDSWFSPLTTPSRPVQFELGSFTVPQNQHLYVYDYEFSVLRLSGVDAGDYVKSEDYRFSGVLGFDINFSGRRLSNLLYQLDPVPILASRPTYEPPIGARATPAQFDRSVAQSFAANASPGTSLLPMRPQRQGARDMPFTLVAKQNDRVSLNCVIFKQIKSPVAAIEGRVAGFLLHTQASNALINRLRPR